MNISQGNITESDLVLFLLWIFMMSKLMDFIQRKNTMSINQW